MSSHFEPKYKIAEASIYKAFYDSVIAPNRSYHNMDLLFRNEEKLSKLSNYWNSLLNKRHSHILKKQLNIFTTNIDLMIEDAANGMGIELNDGFRGSINPIYECSQLYEIHYADEHTFSAHF